MPAAVEGHLVVPVTRQRGLAGARRDGRQGFERDVGTLHVGCVVDVVVKLHGLLVDGRFEGGVIIRQGRQDEFAVLEADLALLGLGGGTAGGRGLAGRRSSGKRVCRDERGRAKTEGGQRVTPGNRVHKEFTANVLGC